MIELRLTDRALACTLAATLIPLAACSPDTTPTAGTSGLVNLFARFDTATVESGAAPLVARQQRRWSFHEPQPGWYPLDFEVGPVLSAVSLEPVEGALRLSVDLPPAPRTMLRIGGVGHALEDGLLLEDFEAVKIRARSNQRFAGMTVVHNTGDAGALPNDMVFFFSTDEAPPVFSDGSEQIYSIPLRPREGEGAGTPLEDFGILVAAVDPASIDLQSIELVPRGASYLDDSGSTHVVRDGETRSTLFAHVPASLTWEVEIPEGGRLDLGVTTAPGEPVTYRVTAGDGEKRETLWEETVADAASWQQRSIDLAALGGDTARLTFEAESEREGAVAFWGAPIVSGSPSGERPNVIFYVIDGGGSDFMSVYGYERPTTPFLEALAAEGAVFERAYSNATWTQPSTVSFMTSLQHSVLGGLRRGVHSTAVPANATTMAEHFRAAGYQTSSFGANPNAGRILGLEKGVDVLRDSGVEHHSTSSHELHERYWGLRSAYPGGPTWTHFQTTDVHEPNHPEAPHAGTWISEERHEELRGWEQQMFRSAGYLFGRTSIADFYDRAMTQTGIDRGTYFDGRRDLHDETMLHQDHELAALVAELKRRGEWENTLLVIGADHGHPAGSFARWGRGRLDPQPEPWQGALFDAYSSRVPLIFIWPGRIPAGQRFADPVSMIDVLPTVLELVGLPLPEVLQGQSLAPMLGGGGQELRPVILDEFRIDEASGELIGNLEIVDGRWGASLEIGPQPEGSEPGRGRYAVPVGGRWGALHPHFPEVPRLLLYDLDADPFATRAVNEEYPELVERYRALLLEQWEAHQALAGRFQAAGDVELSPEQLQQLRSLGYIQ